MTLETTAEGACGFGGVMTFLMPYQHVKDTFRVEMTPSGMASAGGIVVLQERRSSCPQAELRLDTGCSQRLVRRHLREWYFPQTVAKKVLFLLILVLIK